MIARTKNPYRYFLKMRLLAEVDTAGKAVEGAHALMYPLVHVPVA